MAASSEILLNSLRGLLRPIVKFCIRHSIKFQEVQEALKLVFVQLAQDELAENSSVSKISAASGVHRRDVTRLIKSNYLYRRPDNTVARVVALWQFDKRFTDGNGTPKVLDSQGKDSEFAQLVRAVNGQDISSYSILFELERAGIIRKDGTKLTLLGGEVVYGEDIQSGLGLLEADSFDLAEAVQENLFKNGKNLHLRTEFDKIPENKLGEINNWFLVEGTKFHDKVRSYLQGFDLDCNNEGHDNTSFGRVVFSAFSFLEILNNKKEGQ